MMQTRCTTSTTSVSSALYSELIAADTEVVGRPTACVHHAFEAQTTTSAAQKSRLPCWWDSLSSSGPDRLISMHLGLQRLVANIKHLPHCLFRCSISRSQGCPSYPQEPPQADAVYRRSCRRFCPHANLLPSLLRPFIRQLRPKPRSRCNEPSNVLRPSSLRHRVGAWERLRPGQVYGSAL